MKKNIIITILTTTVVLFTILVIIGMNMEDVETTSVSFTPTLKNTFISECISDTVNYAYCSCAFDDLINTYGENEYIRMDNQYKKDQILTDEIINSAKKCLYLNK